MDYIDGRRGRRQDRGVKLRSCPSCTRMVFVRTECPHCGASVPASKGVVAVTAAAMTMVMSACYGVPGDYDTDTDTDTDTEAAPDTDPTMDSTTGSTTDAAGSSTGAGGSSSSTSG